MRLCTFSECLNSSARASSTALTSWFVVFSISLTLAINESGIPFNNSLIFELVSVSFKSGLNADKK